MYKTRFQQCKALRFRRFSRKGYALFACLGRVVTIGVLTVATLRSAAVTSTAMSVTGGTTVTGTASVASDSITDKEATLDDVEVTGSRAPLALGQAARMVSVLSRDDIQAAPVQSINDLLKMAVGVDVRQRGPLGAQTDVGIRGSTSEQVAVLLNGINICDPQTAHNAFDLPCDVDDIVRIEVLEGPAARAYGTSSLAGAINIVTRGNEKLEKKNEKCSLRLEGGSFGYLSAAGRISHFSLPISHSSFLISHLSASATRADGYLRSKSGALNSDYAGGKVFYQGSYEDKSAHLSWHAGLSVKGWGSNTFYSMKFDEQYEHTMKFYTAIQGETSGWFHLLPAVYWNRTYDRFELIRGDESAVPFNYHRTDVAGIKLNGYFDWTMGRTALGAEFRNEDIVSTTLGEPQSSTTNKYPYGLNRSNLSFHLEHNILLRRFTLSAGFLVTHNTWNQQGFTIYPGVDASLRLGSHWKVYASYNTSLRQPSFTELYYSVGGHKADKHLKPEELQAVEGGVKYSSRWLTAQAAIFHHHARNMIDWVRDTRDADAVWQSVNHTRVNTLGQEVTVSCRFSIVNCQLSYCHLHQQKQDDTHLQSQYALEYLRHKATAHLQMPLGNHLQMLISWRWQDRMGSYTTTDGYIADYHPYSVIDARLSWNAENYSLFVEGNNLTNHRYVDYGNVPQPGCWLTAGVKAHF